MKLPINLLVLAVLLWVMPAYAGELVHIEANDAFETITIDIAKRAPHKVFTLPSPDRLVIDVPSVPGKHALALPESYNGTLIKSLRFGQFDPHTSRFVLDLAHAIKVSGVQDVKDGLVITIAPAGQQEEQIYKERTDAGSAAVARAAKPPADMGEEKKIPKERKNKHAAPKPEKPMIVIDPGHGGVDPGTSGAGGTYEKNLTLAYAKELKARLLKTGRYRVKLTHEDDQFIMLRKRVDIARAAGASLFISLHADSAPELAARGLSVYTLSEQSSDKETAALAARENKSDILAGVDLSDEREDVAGILISLAERETKNRSATLADTLVTKLDDRVTLLPNTHRFAGFAVLKAPDIPSVLIEIGFLSHPAEEKLLNSKAYRDKVTQGIADGVDAYFAAEKRMGAP